MGDPGYDGCMEQPSQVSLQRLALVLAGAPLSVRRSLGAATTEDEDAFSILERNGARAMVRAASDLLDAAVPSLLDTLERTGWRWTVPGDEAYPAAVTTLSDPPLGLFVRGPLPMQAGVAVVGSRKATPYGRKVGRMLGEALGRAGLAVVSGMARGVDAAAHEGALESQGTTVAVWGTGPDRVYPPEHGPLSESIVEAGGALVTEFPPGTPPRPQNFPRRNRIIVGLSRAVVVVEARARSGALNTARQALDEGRDVWAVPGSILSELSVGPNALIRMGARPLLVPDDLIRDLGVETAGDPPDQRSAPASPVLDVIPSGRALPPDAIAAAAGLPIGDVLTALLDLELAGLLERLPDGSYARR